MCPTSQAWLPMGPFPLYPGLERPAPAAGNLCNCWSFQSVGGKLQQIHSFRLSLIGHVGVIPPIIGKVPVSSIDVVGVVMASCPQQCGEDRGSGVRKCVTSVCEGPLLSAGDLGSR